MSAARAIELLESDFPQVDHDDLAALLDQCTNQHLDTCADHPKLTPRLLAALETAATRLPPPAHADSFDDLLAPQKAQPSLYAAVYAVACVQRACSLVCDHAAARDLGGALDSYYVVPLDEGAENLLVGTADATDIADAVDVAHTADTDATDAAAPSQEAEVWAAVPDDDDNAYEPLETVPSPFISSNDAVAPPRAATVEERALRLSHLVASLSYSPLEVAAREAWEELGTGEAVLRAIGALHEADEAGRMHALGPPLLRLLRDRFWKAPSALVRELPRSLERIGARLRPTFLAALLADGPRFAVAAVGGWAALETSVRAELPALIREAESGDEAALDLSLQLLECYREAPQQALVRAGEQLLSTGAVQMALGVVLREQSQARQGAACWRWLLGACSRHPAALRFAARVPSILTAVRGSAYLAARTPDRLAWLWLLALERRRAAVVDCDRSGEEIEAEARVGLQLAVASACAVGELAASEALLLIIELLEVLTVATAGALRNGALLDAAVAANLWAEWKAFDERARNLLSESRLTAEGGGPAQGMTDVDGTAAKLRPGSKDALAAQKQRELLERSVRSFKALQLAQLAPSKGD